MSFKQIIGQERPINILQNAILNNRLSHAYLFEGQPGVGKIFTALNFIKAVNCLNPVSGGADCCDECASCKKIDEKNHIDIKWIDLLKGKTQICIEQIRQMQAQINLKPNEAKYKVYCIKDADLMNEEAQSALLKTLEEPPLKSVIILTTANMRSLLATIISRCQLVKFSSLKIEFVKDIFVKRYNMDPDAAYFLAYIAQSGLIDVSLFAKENVLENKNKIINDFITFLDNQSIELRFLKDSEEDILWGLSVILWWYRDMLIFKETGSLDMIANKDRINDIKTSSARFSVLQLGQIISIIFKTLQFLNETNVNAKLALTVMATDILNIHFTASTTK